MNKQVIEFFKSHTSDNSVFETNDGLLFRTDGDAMLHTNSLKIKTITMHLREEVLAAAETETMPVIDKVETHQVEGGESTDPLVTAQSIQPAVTAEVQEQLQTAEKATGDVVNDTKLETGAETKTVDTVKTVTTETGEPAANATTGGVKPNRKSGDAPTGGVKPNRKQ